MRRAPRTERVDKAEQLFSEQKFLVWEVKRSIADSGGYLYWCDGLKENPPKGVTLPESVALLEEVRHSRCFVVSYAQASLSVHVS